ncbi:MAG: glutaredoxin family protein [Candidatus Lokiarchaeota archaeon]|nr:glutaredoxin family protein [Candidatus Lokiarchaeota archaeon]
MPEILEKLAQTVEGSKKNRNITILTLSTCMWCKKCKAWLKDHDVQYKYVDVDQIDFKEKSKIIDYLRDKYQARVSYPYMICDNEVVVGYNPGKYEELMKSGGD